MTRIARILLLLCLSIPLTTPIESHAQSKPDSRDATGGAVPSGPRLQLDATHAELGEHWIDAPFEHEFHIRNTGDAPLQIGSIEPTAGVTTTLDPPGPIGPGGAATLRAIVKDDQMRPGTFEKSITMTTNDLRFPRMKLSVRGKTKYYIEATPYAIGFGRLDGDADEERVVNIRNHADRPVQLAVDESSRQKSFRYQLIETIPGKSWQLYVDTAPPFDAGTIRSEVVLTTDLPTQPEIRLGVYAMMPNRLEVQPSVIAPRAAAGREDDAPLTHVLSVRNCGPKDVRVAGVSCADPRVKTTLHEIRPGRRYRIVVQLPPNYSPPTGGAEVIIKTDDGETPVLTVPIGGSVARRTASARRSAGRTNPPPARRKRRPVMDTIGQPAPSYSLETVEGIRVSNAELEFHPATILNFFAPNCPHCKRQIPRLEKIRKRYEPQGIRFVNVSEKMRKQFSTDEVLGVLADLGANLELAMDPGNQVGRRFKATGYPCLILLRPDGVVDQVVSGNKKDLDAVVSARLDSLLESDGTAPRPVAGAR